MKRVTIFLIIAIITLCSFSSQLLALPEGAVARLGKGSIRDVAFSPDGKMLAVASSIGIWLYDANTYAEIGLLESDGSLTSLAFSPDGSLIANGSRDKTIKLWDVKSRKEIGTLKGHNWFVTSVTFSPDGSILASGSNDGTILLWDMKPYRQQKLWQIHAR